MPRCPGVAVEVKPLERWLPARKSSAERHQRRRPQLVVAQLKENRANAVVEKSGGEKERDAEEMRRLELGEGDPRNYSFCWLVFATFVVC